MFTHLLTCMRCSIKQFPIEQPWRYLHQCSAVACLYFLARVPFFSAIYRSLLLQDLCSNFSDLAPVYQWKRGWLTVLWSILGAKKGFQTSVHYWGSCTNSLIGPVVTKCLGAGHVKVPDNIQALQTPQWMTKNPKLLQYRKKKQCWLVRREGVLSLVQTLLLGFTLTV